MIEEITDKEKIEQVLPRVLDLIHLTYGDEYLGSTNLKRLKKNTSLIQVVRNEDKEIIAGVLCRVGYEGSNKVSAIFSDKSNEGKEAAINIIRKNIDEYDSLVWCEASDAIEHLYKKYQGYPIPSAYAPEILRKNPSEIEFSEEDVFHYSRIIGTDDVKKKVTKVIFGFPSKKLMENFLSDEKYKIERKAFVNIPVLKESISDDIPEDLYYASSFVEQFSDLNEEGKIIEMSPQLSVVLDDSMKVLRKYIDKYDWVKNEYDVAEFLRDEVPVIPHGTMKEVIDGLSTKYI